VTAPGPSCGWDGGLRRRAQDDGHTDSHIDCPWAEGFAASTGKGQARCLAVAHVRLGPQTLGRCRLESATARTNGMSARSAIDACVADAERASKSAAAKWKLKVVSRKVYAEEFLWRE